MTDEELDFYRENGYVLLKGLFTKEEAAEGRARLHAVAHRLYEETRTGADPTWGAARAHAGGQGTVLQHTHDVQFQDSWFSRMILDPRFTGAAARILGPNVQLHHTKMFIKPPEKGSPFPMHQDAPFFPHENHSMIAAIVHFDDAPLEKGCVRVVPGSHKLGLMPHSPDGGWHLDPEAWPVAAATPCTAAAGDVLFLSYLTIHGSGINTSSDARTTVLVQMRDPLDPPSIRTHESRGQGMMLAGVDPSCCTTRPVSDDPADNPIFKLIGRSDCGEVTMGSMGGGMGSMGGGMGSMGGGRM
ncbi:MAG: phytanoyl-CoA dioxygenase family protein [Armatimonadota bacterium]